ncbi:hypothetical protein ACHAXT_011191 [Thalassiosira profunda]
MTNAVHFEGLDDLAGVDEVAAASAAGRPVLVSAQADSTTSLMSAPGAPPEQHRRTSLIQHQTGSEIHNRGSMDDDHLPRRGHRYTATFGGVSKRAAYREIQQARKRTMVQQRGWPSYIEHSFRWPSHSTGVDSSDADRELTEQSGLLGSAGSSGSRKRYTDVEGHDLRGSSMTVSEEDQTKLHLEALKALFMENKINVLFVFLPLAYWSHAHGWNDGAVFILNFLAMVPLASMLGIFTEELAAHTNDVIGGLINATFGNAVELVVAIQALLANDFRVVQASLIGSVFSNILLVLGMCFYFGGIKFPEQEFIAEGAVASIALLAFSGMILLIPEFFAEAAAAEEVDDGINQELMVSRIGALFLILMYAQLLFFQLKTHIHLFEGDNDVVALIPFNWALAGLAIITAIVVILSEWLVGSIDGFCTEFNLGRSFVGVIVLPVVGNAVEHISAVSVAMKNKTVDLALGVALGSAVQIGLFVLPLVVIVGWATGREMSLLFPKFEVYLYLISVIIVSLCLSNQRSNWLEGSLLVSVYFVLAVGIYFEKDDGEKEA